MKFGKGANKFDRFGVIGVGRLENIIGSCHAPRDDEDVIFLQVFMSGLIVDVCADGKAMRRVDALSRSSNGTFKGFGGYNCQTSVSTSSQSGTT